MCGQTYFSSSSKLSFLVLYQFTVNGQYAHNVSIYKALTWSMDAIARILVCVVIDCLKVSVTLYNHMRREPHTLSLTIGDDPIFGKLSNRMPLKGLKMTSFFGPRPPYMPLRNWRISSLNLTCCSTSPLARWIWYANCGAGPFTRSSIDTNLVDGAVNGVQTENTWETSSGCHNTVFQIIAPPLCIGQLEILWQQKHASYQSWPPSTIRL